MTTSAWSRLEAERAFDRARRTARRAALARRFLRRCGCCGRLTVVCALESRARGAGVREIPLAAIAGTVEPNRAAQFDADFRPAGLTRSRWQRVWTAMHRGDALPPISVVAVGDGYAVRDGHHRVSVAKARGAETIGAIVH